MKEILFKAKRVENGKWVEGLLWKKKYNDGNRIFISCFPDKDDNEEVYVVCPETLCEFTGLCDNNGKRIFEGDIIRKGFECFVVKWNSNQCRWGLFDKHDFEVSGFNEHTKNYLEIIGNRFDTSELLTAER